MSSYGFMTHSYLGSTEHRQMKKERAKATANWEASQRGRVPLPIACTCMYSDTPHLTHAELYRTTNWRTRRNFR